MEGSRLVQTSQPGWLCLDFMFSLRLEHVARTQVLACISIAPSELRPGNTALGRPPCVFLVHEKRTCIGSPTYQCLQRTTKRFFLV